MLFVNRLTVFCILTFFFIMYDDLYSETKEKKYQFIAWAFAVTSGALLYAIFDS